MNCVKHGSFYEAGFCPVCQDLEIAETLKWEADSALQEDLEDLEEYVAAVASKGE